MARSRETQLGASLMFTASLMLLGICVSASMFLESWAFVVGGAVFCVPVMIGTAALLMDEKGGER
jgi:hypothetical protein